MDHAKERPDADSNALPKEYPNSERWNQLLTQGSGREFNRDANGLIQQAVLARAPGRALDVGIGEGRNALFLARQGWEVYGVDIADEAIALANERATREGLTINTTVISVNEFDLGVEQWDLIALIYLATPFEIEPFYRSIRPGGILVMEHFAGTAKRHLGLDSPREGAVRRLFVAAGFEIEFYEEAVDIADFGGQRSANLIRVVARKPE